MVKYIEKPKDIKMAEHLHFESGCEKMENSEIMSYLIGALADGSIYHNPKHYVYRVSYYQKSKLYLLNCIEPRIEQLFNKKGHFYFDRRKGVYFYEITSKQIFLHYQTVLESYKAETNRSVPSWIKEGDELIYNAFIRGFFDAEGYYHMRPENSDYRVRFGQAEYYILKDLKDLLEKEFECSDVLGPYQSKKNAKPYYELHIHGIKQLLKFHKIVRPCHPNKQLGGKKLKEECV